MMPNKLLIFLSIAIAILTLGRFIFWVFPLELLTHFQVHYFWLTIALIIAFIILWQQQKIQSQIALFILLFTLVINSLDLVTWYLPTDRISANRSNILKVMSFNIKIENTDLDRLVRSIRSTDPDLALVVEIDAEKTTKIAQKTIDLFPYSFRSPGGDLAIFSKFSLADSSGQKFPNSDDTPFPPQELKFVPKAFSNQLSAVSVFFGAHVFGT